MDLTGEEPKLLSYFVFLVEVVLKAQLIDLYCSTLLQYACMRNVKVYRLMYLPNAILEN